ncbi:MAG: IclR family transcriptional regulator [Pseudolysinimonas sp.]
MANSGSGESVIERVVRILATFDRDRRAQTPSAIARRAGLPSSTAFRMVNELLETGLLERDEQGGVRIGMHLWELTARGSHALDLRQAAMPAMEEVQSALREHTQLGVLEHEEVLFIERLSGPGAGSNVTQIAGRLPLHASSSGLVLLAHGPIELLERVLSEPLAALTPETITDPAALRRKLDEVRRLGYAWAPGFIETVSTGIAVPVRDGGEVVAALSVVLPRERDDAGTVVPLLQAAATRIAEELASHRLRSR